VTAGQEALHADEGLVQRAARGEAEAFELLLSTRLDRLYRLAVAITRNEADARDAVQEASVQAWRNLPSLRDHARFDPWLAQIVVNACRADLRRRRRVTSREVELEPAGGGPGSGLATPSQADAVGEADAIRAAFERLGVDDRTLIVLHYVEQRPLAEIAQVMGRPVGTVKWRLSRARQALDRALEVERR
jgi:RNA polymerase sigma-70 factor (ECF subfamily)